MKNQKMTKDAVMIGLGAGAVCAAALSALTFHEKKERKERLRNFAPAICPICGTILTTNNECPACGGHFHPCPSCGKMMKDTACFCKHCGMENEDANYCTLRGFRYKVPKREPESKMEVNHSYCSCGTPFAPDAKYCQFCGKVRPKPGESYIRKDLPS